jgi:hypothetical protein
LQLVRRAHANLCARFGLVVLTLIGLAAWLAAPAFAASAAEPTAASSVTVAVAATTTTSSSTVPAPTTTTSTTVRADPCVPAPGTALPDIVSQVWKCRLTPILGLERATWVAAEAVVVAQCESLFDPNAVVFDGAYLNQPHPQTGMYYSAAGLFQFIRRVADEFIDGGYAAATDPVKNTEGAVRLWLDTRSKGGVGWENWECAAVNGAFRGNSVLPGWPNGPAKLPSWAFRA